MRFKTFYLTEDIIQGGRLVTFYHRTGRDVDLTDIDSLFKDKSSIINSIKNSGLKAGSGEMYGKGIYGTYELESQLNNRMEGVYGQIIVKMKTIIERILIFDYKTAKKVYGKKYTILDQLNKFRITINPNDIDDITKFSEELESSQKISIQSNYVKQIIHNYLYIYKKLNGIMYYGNLDGYTIVVYKEKIITPMSINTTFNNPTKLDQPTWIDIKNKDLIKKTLELTTISKDNSKKAILLQKAIKSSDFSIEELDDMGFIDNFISGKNLVIKKNNNNSDLELTDGQVKCTTYEDGVVKGNAKVECDTWKNGSIYDNTKVKCETWKDGFVRDKTEVKCDTWEIGSVYDNAKVKCETWKDGFVYDKAQVKCETWKDGIVYDNAKVECETWKEGIVKGNAKVECNTWKDGVVYENAQVYIKGKLAKIENNMVVQ